MILVAMPAYSKDKFLKAWKSPNGSYICYIPQTSDQSERELFIKSLSSGKEVKVLDITRWIEIDWAPNSDFFAVTNHWTGHDASIAVFSVKQIDQLPQISLVYKTPPSGRSYVEWKVVKWKMNSRKIVLQHREEQNKASDYKKSMLEVDLLQKNK